jgi:hypothetical protein
MILIVNYAINYYYYHHHYFQHSLLHSSLAGSQNIMGLIDQAPFCQKHSDYTAHIK